MFYELYVCSAAILCKHDLYVCMFCGLFEDVSSISRICLMYSRVLPLIRNRVLHD
jgi:hypothetical protein